MEGSIMTSILLAIFAAHFIADFVLQSDWMAINKSTRMVPLFVHISVYTSVMMIFGWKFALANGAAHLVTDFFTSRGSSFFYKRKQNHWFFVVIGFDQLVHQVTLILTAKYLLGAS